MNLIYCKGKVKQMLKDKLVYSVFGFVRYFDVLLLK